MANGVYFDLTGLLANRERAENLKRCRALLGSSGPTEAPAARREAAERAPTDANERSRCKVCGVGQVRHVGPLAPIPDLHGGTPGTPPPRDTS